MFSNQWQKWLKGKSASFGRRSRRRSHSNSARPKVESLEARMLLFGYSVTTPLDHVMDPTGVGHLLDDVRSPFHPHDCDSGYYDTSGLWHSYGCSLRAAITHINTEHEATNEIRFGVSSVTASGLPSIMYPVTIDGGSYVTLTGSGLELGIGSTQSEVKGMTITGAPVGITVKSINYRVHDNKQCHRHQGLGAAVRRLLPSRLQHADE